MQNKDVIRRITNKLKREKDLDRNKVYDLLMKDVNYYYRKLKKVGNIEETIKYLVRMHTIEVSPITHDFDINTETLAVDYDLYIRVYSGNKDAIDEYKSKFKNPVDFNKTASTSIKVWKELV